MDWSEEEVEDLARSAYDMSPVATTMLWEDAPESWRKHALDIARTVAARAIELAAARGGTMTAEQVEQCLVAAEVETPESAEDLRHHITALGARNALLEAEVKRLSECAAVTETMAARRERDEARRSADELQRQQDSSNDALEYAQERLSAAEEGNRELVRRAQQAEAERDQWKTEHGSAMRRWKAEKERAETWRKRVEAAAEELADVGAGEVGRLDIVSRVRMLKARCAPLPAAGQVLSAHVSNDARAAITDCPMTETCVVCGASPGEACNPRVRHHLRECGQTRGCALMKHHPCSPTCTHDDAATPGHPERVKERSEAVNEAAASDLNQCECCGEGLCSWCRLADQRSHFDEGAEAMRAACMNVVQFEMEKCGASREEWESMKSAIEGAAP